MNIPSISPAEADRRLRLTGDFSIGNMFYTLVGPQMCPIEDMYPCASDGSTDWFPDVAEGAPVTDSTVWFHDIC